ncbi:MAG: hypothetical protein ACJ795_09460 [Ktedonobacteraceae bacterium]
MSSNTKGIQKAFILWVSGVRLDDIRALAEVESLMEQGVLIELDPSPITGPQAQHYQLLSGWLPACFGFFDTLMPLCHLPNQRGANTYDVVEKHTGWDVAPKMLPELLNAAGWMTEYVETAPTELVQCAQRLTRSQAIDASCKIVKCTLAGDGQLTVSTGAEAIAEALRVARSWVGEAGMLALLSDTQQAPVECFLNINNFLAEMNLIELDEQSHQIDWAGSLAYYVGHGQLWINLLGREPQGVVHPQDEYEEVRDTLIKVLPIKLRDPQTGMPVIERVYRREELYPDQYLFCAPDLVILFKPGYAPSPRSAHLEFDESTFTVPVAGTVVMSGAHPSLLRGFLLVSAPSMISGVSVSEPAPLISVVPSLLHAFAVEHAEVEGSALGCLFKPSYLEINPIRTDRQSQELSEEDEQLVIERLRDLGYI